MSVQILDFNEIVDAHVQVYEILIGANYLLYILFQILGMVFAMVLYCAITKEGEVVWPSRTNWLKLLVFKLLRIATATTAQFIYYAPPIYLRTC